MGTPSHVPLLTRPVRFPAHSRTASSSTEGDSIRSLKFNSSGLETLPSMLNFHDFRESSG